MSAPPGTPFSFLSHADHLRSGSNLQAMSRHATPTVYESTALEVRQQAARSRRRVRACTASTDVNETSQRSTRHRHLRSRRWVKPRLL